MALAVMFKWALFGTVAILAQGSASEPSGLEPLELPGAAPGPWTYEARASGLARFSSS